MVRSCRRESVNDKAGGDAWAKMEDVTGASESMAMAEEKLEACRSRLCRVDKKWKTCSQNKLKPSPNKFEHLPNDPDYETKSRG